MLNEVTNATNFGGHHRPLTGERFNHRHAEGLVNARNDDHAGALVESHEILSRLPSKELDLICEHEIRAQSFEHRFQLTIADNFQMYVWKFFPDVIKGPYQVL